MTDINDVSHTSTLAKLEEAVRKDERSRISPETASAKNLLERLDDQGLYNKAERIQMIKDAAAEIRRLRGLAQTGQQWQPIETAPQDGTPVIVWDDPVRGEAYFETGDKAWWWTNTGPGDYVGDAIYPTLWQPLPALPDTSTDRSGK
jgi:hypothetical protein